MINSLLQYYYCCSRTYIERYIFIKVNSVWKNKSKLDVIIYIYI